MMFCELCETDQPTTQRRFSLDGDAGIYACDDCMTNFKRYADSLKSLATRHPAETTFTGLGLWDIFAPGRVLVGTVALDLAAPPFVRGDGKEFNFAQGYFLFAHGLIQETEGIYQS